MEGTSMMSWLPVRPAKRHLALACVPMALATFVGCAPREGVVSGRVFLGDEVLPGGRVTFRPADPRHNSVSAELDERGNYRATLPMGEVQISVDNRELGPVPLVASGVPAGLPPSVKKALG